MSKIWSKDTSSINSFVESYTVGDDHILDNYDFFHFDIQGSAAHVESLLKSGVINAIEHDLLQSDLNRILKKWKLGNIEISVSDEDCHSVIERELIESLGDIGKKIHTGRSRNDQALTMIRLYMVSTLQNILINLGDLSQKFFELQEKYRDTPFIGYTHTQQAMPITLGHYYNAFYEQTTDDLAYCTSIFKSISKNPLGSGAGFGSTVNLDRELTTSLLGFESLQKNSLYCQNSRGKFELQYIHAMSQVMLTLQKFATDMILYTSREFSLFRVNPSITTGSSMMPQKKNLDIAEIIRGNHGMIVGYETQVHMISHGLISGYNRDYQLMKKSIVESYKITSSSISAASVILDNIEPDVDNIMSSIKSDIYAADLATIKSQKEGIPFRDSYRLIMEQGDFNVDFNEIIKMRKTLGSPGNF
jgi:argininosuccinate lyase